MVYLELFIHMCANKHNEPQLYNQNIRLGGVWFAVFTDDYLFKRMTTFYMVVWDETTKCNMNFIQRFLLNPWQDMVNICTIST